MFARTGASVGKSYLYDPADGPLVFAGFLIRVQPNEDVQPAFLTYCVQTERYWGWVASTSSRSGQPGINGREYGTYQLWLPPPDEQCAIAEALSDVDRLIESLEVLIAKKRAVKTAAMQQLLTGKIRLPGFGGGWERMRFGDVCIFLPTANNPRGDLEGRGDVLYIHYGNVHVHPLPVLDCSHHELPRIEDHRIGNASRLRDGDLVMVDASEDLAGIGKSVEIMGVGKQEIVPGLHTILSRGKSRHWAAGFKSYLQYIPEFKSSLERLAAGISVYAVSGRQLADVVLALPPLQEQAAIVSVLSDIDGEIGLSSNRCG